jgi:hypothetical protein
MTACMQPDCPGTILDGYCDVCGSPAGAVPFVPAELPASVGSPAPADEPGLAIRLGSGLPSEPKQRSLTACTQPGCPGIVDCYCDVCGSPAGAIPFVPAAASAESPASGDKFGLTAIPPSTPSPAHVDEERPTQPIPRVKMPTQQFSKQGMADPGVADPGVVDAQKVEGEKVDRAVRGTEKVNGKKELAEDEADGAQDYRTRVEEAQLPDHVREAALREIAKLERTTDQTPECGEIRAWLDTVLDLTWGTTITDSIDIEGSREVEASLPRLIEPAAVDVEGDDAAKLESAVGDVEGEDAAGVEAVVADTELDADLDMPWGSKTPDWIDIEGSREVEASLRKLIEPAVGDVEEEDAAKLEPAVGDTEGDDAAGVEAVVGDTELDADLDLPWGTEITDSIDIEGSREVEASLRKLIEPAAVDVEGDDGAEVEPAAVDVEGDDGAEVEPAAVDVEGDDADEVEAVAADTENADRAPAGPQDDDTVVTPAVLTGFSERVQPRPQLTGQQVVRPVLVETPTETKRYRSLALAAALAALLIGALFFAASRGGSVTARSEPSVTATATVTLSKPTSEPSNESTGSVGKEATIQLEDLPDSARPFEAVRIQGTYRGGTGTFLRVQRWDGGKWLDFPLPTKTDQSGHFITQAEFGQPGRYQLRVLDPDSGVTSEPFVVVIKG